MRFAYTLWCYQHNMTNCTDRYHNNARIHTHTEICFVFCASGGYATLLNEWLCSSWHTRILYTRSHADIINRCCSEYNDVREAKRDKMINDLLAAQIINNNYRCLASARGASPVSCIYTAVTRPQIDATGNRAAASWPMRLYGRAREKIYIYTRTRNSKVCRCTLGVSQNQDLMPILPQQRKCIDTKIILFIFLFFLRSRARGRGEDAPPHQRGA